ncbi:MULTISPECIES: endo alpha-1,4 polygalactosaminidase [unclassified Streptomyces]|uniref:endo alpha-1,4 polygalactosaminidase n=1 Tax=unclassified Streptomyces TaxID=2593676 RepID=UPI0033FB486A
MLQSIKRVRFHRSLAALATVVGVAAATSLLASPFASAATAAVTLPPTHANFDYQIGGAYTPPAGVTVVSRDREASPAAGLYNICYINAFQVQPGAEEDWDSDLLLRDADGNVVYDEDWGEAMLDVSTTAKQRRIANKVNVWIDECAAKGFKAVEPDNFDSYTRSGGLLESSEAEAYIKLLSAHAHSRGLAIAQKNTAELAENRVANGLDFAVAEECGEWEECDTYTDAFGDNVIVIEYSKKGMSTACAGWGDQLSIVRRDTDVLPVGSAGYLRATC